MDVLEQLRRQIAASGADPDATDGARSIFTRTSVEDSADLRRIEALPRRQWTPEQTEEMVELLTRAYAKNPNVRLRKTQAQGLSDAHDYGGLLGPIGVGEGKTLMSLLLPVVLDAKQPALILPAKLKAKTFIEAKEYEKDWKIATYFHVESYEMLGRVQGADFLERIKPDLLIFDEGHRAKNPRAAVTRRLKRYLEANPHVRVVVLSGTMTKRSLKDFAHLAKWALPRSNPTPEDWGQTEIWAQAIDEKTRDTQRVHPGELVRLCNDEERREFSLSPIQGARMAFRRRLVDTPGVIATAESQLGVSLSLEMTEPHVGQAVDEAFVRLRKDWETPDGQDVTDAIGLWRHARELACGFYYRWVVQPPADWKAARKAWAKFVRDVIKHNRSGIDSELQVAQACALAIRHRDEPAPNSRYARAPVPQMILDGLGFYEAWVEVRPSFTPETEAVWIDDHMINFCIEWLKHHQGIVWTDMIAFGERLSEISGLPYFGAQARCARTRKFLYEHPAGKSMIASVASVGEGQNLQAWHKNLVASAPQTGATWEQMMGRTHRPGQLEDEVTVLIPVACTEQYKGVMQALADCKYMQTITGQDMKMVYADKLFFDASDLMKRQGQVRWAKSGLEKDE